MTFFKFMIIIMLIGVKQYYDLSYTDEQVVAALVNKIFRSSRDSKAAGLDSLTAEHLKYSHSALATILAKLFNIMLILTVYRPHSVAVTSSLYRRAAM